MGQVAQAMKLECDPSETDNEARSNADMSRGLQSSTSFSDSELGIFEPKERAYFGNSSRVRTVLPREK